MSAYGAVAGLNKMAARLTRGAISLSSSSHLPVIVGSITVNPVALPPGWAKLSTKPLPTGSATITKTMGMERVCCSIDAVRDEFLRGSLPRLRVIERTPPCVDADIAAFRPPKLLKCLPECGDVSEKFRI